MRWNKEFFEQLPSTKWEIREAIIEKQFIMDILQLLSISFTIRLITEISVITFKFLRSYDVESRKKKSLYTQFSLDKPIDPDPAFAGALCTVCE